MAVKLRLMRMGKKKQPTYRVVAADARSPRDGRFIELIGRYDPRAEPSVVEIDNDKAVAWLHKGAQPTDQVRKLLEISGAWADFRVSRGEILEVQAPAQAKPDAPPPAEPVAGHRPEIHVVGEDAAAEDEPAPGPEAAAGEPAAGEPAADDATAGSAADDEPAAGDAEEADDV